MGERVELTDHPLFLLTDPVVGFYYQFISTDSSESKVYQNNEDKWNDDSPPVKRRNIIQHIFCYSDVVKDHSHCSCIKQDQENAYTHLPDPASVKENV